MEGQAPVCVFVDRGKLRLRFSRDVFGGKQRKLSLCLDDTPANRATAKVIAAHIEGDIAAGRFDRSLTRYKPDSREFTGEADLMTAWEAFAEERKREVDECTAKSHYDRTTRYLGKLPPALLRNPDATCRFVAGDKPLYTAKRIISQINSAIAWWNQTHYDILETPAPIPRLSRVRESKQPDPFSLREARLVTQAFREHANYYHYADLIEFMFLTGCRPGEAVALPWVNVDLQSATLLINRAYNSHERRLKFTTKNDVSRRLPVGDRLAELLRKRQRETKGELVFPAVKGGFIDAHNLSNRGWRGAILPQLLLEGKVSHYRPLKNTRHTFVSLCLTQGVPLFTVAHWVGDRVDTLSKRYAAYLGSDRLPDVLNL